MNQEGNDKPEQSSKWRETANIEEGTAALQPLREALSDEHNEHDGSDRRHYYEKKPVGDDRHEDCEAGHSDPL
jgi:hypothetical protein